MKYTLFSVSLVGGDFYSHGILYSTRGFDNGPVCAEGFDETDAGKKCFLLELQIMIPWSFTRGKTFILDYHFEPGHDKTNKMACAPSKDSDQPGHPLSLIRVFAVCMKKAWLLSYPLSRQQRLCSHWAGAHSAQTGQMPRLI